MLEAVKRVSLKLEFEDRRKLHVQGFAIGLPLIALTRKFEVWKQELPQSDSLWQSFELTLVRMQTIDASMTGTNHEVTMFSNLRCVLF